MKTFILTVLAAATVSAQTFPLKISANNRYFVDQNNTPFFLAGDAPWDLPCALSIDSAMIYIKNADSLGFTLMEWRLLTKTFTKNAPSNIHNVAPFTGTIYQSSLNEAYWAHVDSLLDSCATRNIVVWCFPAYLGYGGGGSDQGFYDEVNAASTAQMKSFGQALGQRWQNRNNILWAVGGDADPTGVKAKLDSMMVGILQYCNRPRAPRNEPETIASTHWGVDTFSVTFNGFYSYSSTLYTNAKNAYNASATMPYIEQECVYENEQSSTRQQVTGESYWSVLGGATAGYFVGNCPLWNFSQWTGGLCGAGGSWVAALQNPARKSMKYLNSILKTRHWYTLVPDTANAVADSGYSSGTTYVTTAFASDSSCIISYLPTQHNIRVKLGYIKGDSVACKWVNAADGTETDLGKKARVTTTFAAPTNADYVLVLDSYSTSSAFVSRVLSK